MSKLSSPDCHTQGTNTILKFKETYLETMKSAEPMQWMVFKKDEKELFSRWKTLAFCNGLLKPCSTSLLSWIEQVTLERIFLSQGRILRGAPLSDRQSLV